MYKTSNYYKNQISQTSILISTVIFIFLIVVNVFLLILFWPDTMPESKRNFPPIYVLDTKFCQLKLTDSAYFVKLAKQPPTEPVGVEKFGTKFKSAEPLDSLESIKDTANLIKDEDDKEFPIHLNNLLFILVVLGGFLGNLIHIATSFTTFVGLRKFKQSWLMWYYVKPFIASALALAVYVLYRGGFTSLSYEEANINPYGIVSLAILTGLFSKSITDKLGKILDVIFPGTEETLDGVKEPILNDKISPEEIIRGKQEIITISGEGLDQFKKLSIFINEKPVVIGEFSNNKLTITYTHAETDTSDKIKVDVKEMGETMESYIIKVVNTPLTAV